MKVVITWRELFPFPDDPASEINHTEEKELETLDFNEVEKQAILDTPDGCFLFKIELPHTEFRYDKQGNKTQHFKPTR